MTTMPDDTETQAAAQRALFVDLDFVASDGFDRLYQAAGKILKAKDIDMSPGLFAATLLSRPPARGVAHLLSLAGRDRLSVDKLTEEISKAAVAAISEGDLSPVTRVTETIDHARKAGLAIGAMTRLDADRAGRVLEKLELSDKVDVVEALGRSPFSSPTGDCWLRLARTACVAPRACVAVAASAKAARTALYAAMSCIAIPSVYTACEDFGGVDAVLDDASALTAALDAVLEGNR